MSNTEHFAELDRLKSANLNALSLLQLTHQIVHWYRFAEQVSLKVFAPFV